jgi:hypothetical protein
MECRAFRDGAVMQPVDVMNAAGSYTRRGPEVDHAANDTGATP